MEKQEFEKELKNFLKGFLNSDERVKEEAEQPSDVYSDDKDKRSPKPNVADMVVSSNYAADLGSGKLLLGVQKDNTIYTFDLETEQYEIVCTLKNTDMFLWRAVPLASGEILCTLSGARLTGKPMEVTFGVGGAVVIVNNETGTFREVPNTEDLLDPCDVVVLNEEEIILADFGGFGGTGSVYRLNIKSGKRVTITSGGLLVDPVAIALDKKKGDLYIANSVMSYDIMRGPAGKSLSETAAILKVNINDEKGLQEVVYDETNSPRGEIDTLIVSETNDKILFTRNDWPMQKGSAIGIFSQKNQRLMEISNFKKVVSKDLVGLTTSTMFVRAGAQTIKANSEIVYIADSYNNMLHAYDLAKNTFEKTYSMNTVLGSYMGVASPFDSVESIYLIE